MAITLTKQPAAFFNCTGPAIFEFTTDAAVGNFDDYVCDIYIKSAYTTKTAVIRNIFPNTNTRIFTVDVAEFMKSLQLNNFEFDFTGSKNYGVEKFTLDIKIRDGSVPADDVFSFNDYYFDNLVFTDGLTSVDQTDEAVYSILGERLIFDNYANPINAANNTFLTPKVIEICKGFDNYIPIFINERTANTITAGGVSSNIPDVKGVGYGLLSAGQLAAVNSLREITTNNQNAGRKLYAYPFVKGCAPVVQLRFFNPLGGFSYFYAEIADQTADRSKVTFYDRAFSNENENKSAAVQSDNEYKNGLAFSGSKIIGLKQNFDFLLRSPKIEMNLKEYNGNDIFIECEIVGSSADRFTNFDYKLTAKISNSGNFKL